MRSRNASSVISDRAKPYIRTSSGRNLRSQSVLLTRSNTLAQHTRVFFESPPARKQREDGWECLLLCKISARSQHHY